MDDKIQVVRRNVRFTAAKGSPEERAVHLAYTDSVLFSLPIATIGPGGGYVVDLAGIFMTDLPQFSHFLPGFNFARDKSNWAAAKGFRDNVEIEVAATYSSGGAAKFDTVPDSRGADVNVHYSISLLPQTGYQSRLADDRVGYFLTAVKDFSKRSDRGAVHPLHQPLGPAKGGPVGGAVPAQEADRLLDREDGAVRVSASRSAKGILEWNKAFEKAGFANAIEVRQQPDEADWDPEDINYNTFRWITAGAAFAMGPSRG